MARMINLDDLIERLGISEECGTCQHSVGLFCDKSRDFVDACEAIFELPVMEVEDES